LQKRSKFIHQCSPQNISIMAKAKKPMTPTVAAKIQSEADKHPKGKTAETGFKERAQKAAAKKK